MVFLSYLPWLCPVPCHLALFRELWLFWLQLVAFDRQGRAERKLIRHIFFKINSKKEKEKKNPSPTISTHCR